MSSVGRHRRRDATPKSPTVLIDTGTSWGSRVVSTIDGVAVRHVGAGIYTTDLEASDASILMTYLHEIASVRFPGAVVSDRSAFRTGQETYAYDRALFLVWHRTARLELPGVSIRARKGTRHVLDVEYAAGYNLYRASAPRAFLDPLRPSRRHGEVAPRSMSRSWIVSELARYHDLRELRHEAKRVADDLGLHAELAKLESLMNLLEQRRATHGHEDFLEVADKLFGAR